MDTFKINIIKTPYSQDGAWPQEYQVYTNRGREFLFFFYKSTVSDNLWYFHLPEKGNDGELYFTCEHMPVEYILKLAQALILIRYGVVDFDIQLTQEAQRVLKVK